MKAVDAINKKILTLPQILSLVAAWRVTGKSISFTNGCFDILHEGHMFSFAQAAKEGDCLVVGINSDQSTKRLKGPERPINNEQSRALLLANIAVIDAVVIFDEDTPLELITAILPDVIVKGGDYTIEQIVGSKEILANGGRVVINPIVPGFSTTGIIQQIKSSFS
jgi:D-beta-D-heptose 7-phosphate kinase/D-beta-D-heptose 1-phosphate adenosyltransferase